MKKVYHDVNDGLINLSEMNFEVSNNQKNFLERVDKVCKSLRLNEEKSYLRGSINEKLIPEFSKIGMLGCPISRRFGGLGYDILTYLLALERIGQEGSSMRTFFSCHTSIGQLVLQMWSNNEQKRRYLPNTTKGKAVMAFALTEPEAGSDPSLIKTSFEDKGDHYLIHGKKHWIGNGTFAKIITTYAKEKGNSSSNISAFIIDMDSSHIKKREIKNKMGLLTVKNAIIEFDKCKIPKDNLLGIQGQGLSIAFSALIDGRLSVAAGAIGVMTDCLQQVVEYSKKRYQHGSHLANKQLIQRHIAKIAIAMETTKWVTYRAAIAKQKLNDYIESLKQHDDKWILKLNRNNKIYSDLRRESDKLAAMAKHYATNSSFDVANRSVQIFGSEGYKKTSRVARHFLDSRATTIYEGANEVIELKIASEILGSNFNAY